jgi:hypothetical protein
MSFNAGEESERLELVGSKWACCILPNASKFGDFCTPHIQAKMGV